MDPTEETALKAELQFQERFVSAVKRGVQSFGPRHQLAHCMEELSELITELARILRFEDRPMSPEFLDAARKECADAMLALGSAREILGHEEVDYQVYEKLARYEKRLNAFEHGYTNCGQGHMENAPFCHVGGLACRTDFRPPRWWHERYPNDDGRLLRAYHQGYAKAAREIYGPDWQTCEFGWTPALCIEPEHLRHVKSDHILDDPSGTVETPPSED